MKEKYYKISESELLRLLKRDIDLSYLECSGVDNWDDGGEVTRMFIEDCQAANLDPDNSGYEDLAKLGLKNFEEV